MLAEERPPSGIAATPHATVDGIVGDVRGSVPIRLGFVQAWEGSEKRPGPLSSFANSGDHRGLLLYLLAMTRATRSDPWDVTLPSAVWARALGVPLPTSRSATSSISKAWLRIERRRLIRRSRSRRMARIELLREDGSGGDYSHPGQEGRYFRLPTALWLSGPPDGGSRWFEVLDLPALVMLLVSSTLKAGFAMPAERAPEWYGFSADTAQRGFVSLRERGILNVRRQYRTAPLSALGYTYVNRYTLEKPFGHRRAGQTGPAGA